MNQVHATTYIYLTPVLCLRAAAGAHVQAHKHTATISCKKRTSKNALSVTRTKSGCLSQATSVMLASIARRSSGHLKLCAILALEEAR